MSIQFPAKRLVSDRKYHEAGVRGRFENNLRVVRGRIDTPTPTILEGVGFSVTRNGVGDVTITFDPPFSELPTVAATPQTSIPAFSRLIVTAGAPTASTVRLAVIDPGIGAAESSFHFIATGPA